MQWRNCAGCFFCSRRTWDKYVPWPLSGDKRISHGLWFLFKEFLPIYSFKLSIIQVACCCCLILPHSILARWGIQCVLKEKLIFVPLPQVFNSRLMYIFTKRIQVGVTFSQTVQRKSVSIWMLSSLLWSALVATIVQRMAHVFFRWIWLFPNLRLCFDGKLFSFVLSNRIRDVKRKRNQIDKKNRQTKKQQQSKQTNPKNPQKQRQSELKGLSMLSCWSHFLDKMYNFDTLNEGVFIEKIGFWTKGNNFETSNEEIFGTIVYCKNLLEFCNSTICSWRVTKDKNWS